MTIKYLINKLNLRIPRDQWQYVLFNIFKYPKSSYTSIIFGEH